MDREGRHAAAQSGPARRGANAGRRSLSLVAKASILSSCLLSLPLKSGAQEANAEDAGADLLQGAGLFNKPSDLDRWIKVSDSYFLSTPPSSDKQYLELPKNSKASGFFDDGLTFLFKDGEELASVRPRHIHFEVSTSTADMMETCDVRLYSVEKVEPKANKNESGRLLQDGDQEEPSGDAGDGQSETPEEGAAEGSGNEEAADDEDNQEGEEEGDEPPVVEPPEAAPAGPSDEYRKKEFSDVAFFRLGYYDFMKVNTQNMLKKFKADEWYSVDLLINFETQRVSTYIDGEPTKSDAFFTQRETKISDANALSIYGLSPGGTSRFRNIQVCNDVCPSQVELKMEDLAGAQFPMTTGLSLLMGLSAMVGALLA